MKVHACYLSAALSVVNSAALRHEISAALSNRRVKTVEEIRRDRLQQLVEDHGSYAALNEKIGLERRDSTLNQIGKQSQNSKTKTPKTMGSPMARRIEAALKLEPGWMDNEPSAAAIAWPFEFVDESRYRKLGSGDQGYAQGKMMAAIEEREEALRKLQDAA
jgi:hypothetical protein